MSLNIRSVKKVSMSLIIVLLAISDSLTYVSYTGFNNNYSTLIILVSKYISLFILIYTAFKIKFSNIERKIIPLFKFLLFWNFFTIIHGLFKANNYWEWKFVFSDSLLFLCVPLAFFVGKSLLTFKWSLHYTFVFLFVFGFVLLPIGLLTNEELYSRIMMPVTFLIVFIPYVNKKQTILIIAVSIVSFLSVLDFRANLIKITIGFIVLLTYRYQKGLLLYYIKKSHALLFLMPIFFLMLGASGVFNLFDNISKKEGYNVKTKLYEQSSLTADTRTFLYEEVFFNLKRNNTWILGEGATGEYKSMFFTEGVLGNIRSKTEVGFLNTLLYSGIIGFLIYGIFLYFVSYYAIFKANNWLSVMLGLIITSRWILCFIEEFSLLDLNLYFFWIIIGLVSNKQFRSLSNDDLVTYIKVSI